MGTIRQKALVWIRLFTEKAKPSEYLGFVGSPCIRVEKINLENLKGNQEQWREYQF